ncbi:MAG: acylglycerol lipase-like protein [Ramlibacter sp.]|nr:acylglycerol lipase-like protein [Ramlibacter sp.]
MSEALGESTLSTYTASDGDNLAVQDWPAPERVAPRGMVVLVHGLGEHAGRYHHVAERLNSCGFAVRGYDQYGHGESDGVRGALPRPARLVEDLIDVIGSTRKRMDAGAPLILLGHSLGGLVAGLLVALDHVRVEGLVLSSPALAVRLNPLQKVMLGTLPQLAPHFTIGSGLNPKFLCHDAAVVAAYRADRRVHDRVSARLGAFLAETGPKLVGHAIKWKVPTLLMFAGQDKLIDPAGSRAFAARAPKDIVSSHCFPELFHEIFNEPDNAPVFDTLTQWLDERF